jgi:hypothetical protein
MMGRSATFFFARYEGVPRGHLNQFYERTDQVFSALPSRPTGDMSVDFLDMSAKGRAACNAALSSITCPRLQRHGCVPRSMCGCCRREQTATPTGTHFSTSECNGLKNSIDNQEKHKRVHPQLRHTECRY